MSLDVGNLPALHQVDCPGPAPSGHAQLVPQLGCCYTVCWFAEKEWFLTGKSRAQTLVKTLPSAYGAGNHSTHGPTLIYGRLACKWWQCLNRSTGSTCTSSPTTRITSRSPTTITITTPTTSRRGSERRLGNLAGGPAMTLHYVKRQGGHPPI